MFHSSKLLLLQFILQASILCWFLQHSVDVAAFEPIAVELADETNPKFSRMFLKAKKDAELPVISNGGKVGEDGGK